MKYHIILDCVFRSYKNCRWYYAEISWFTLPYNFQFNCKYLCYSLFFSSKM